MCINERQIILLFFLLLETKYEDIKKVFFLPQWATNNMLMNDDSIHLFAFAWVLGES
jgi:hypothetical protein